MTSSPEDHWANHARQWAHVRPPLRPCADDTGIVTQLLAEHFPNGRPLRVLLLGVTPELVALPLPSGSHLVAVEQNAAMIEHVWQPQQDRTVARGTWQALPSKDESTDVVLGDGCFTTLPTRADYQSVCSEIARVLGPDGVFLHRFFVRPDEPETPKQVFADLEGGLIPQFEIFKWRIAMCLVDPSTATVTLSHIFRTIEQRLDGDLSKLTHHGFPEAAVRTLEHYRDVEKQYSFPTTQELSSWMAPTFHPVSTICPSYPLGERCVHTVWRRTPGA